MLFFVPQTQLLALGKKNHLLIYDLQLLPRLIQIAKYFPRNEKPKIFEDFNFSQRETLELKATKDSDPLLNNTWPSKLNLWVLEQKKYL